MPRSFSSDAIRILTLPELQNAFENDMEVCSIDFKLDNYLAWLQLVMPDHKIISNDLLNKKKLELYATYTVLNIDQARSFLDAAGGKHSYAGRLRSDQRAYVQDIFIHADAKSQIGSKPTFIECSIDTIPVESGSLNAIACHHSFEHFQNDIDTLFILELQRVLAPSGRAAILPIFLSSTFIELTNRADFVNWSSNESIHLFDPRETLPGRNRSGHYARIYDPESFRARVLDHIDRTNYKPTLLELTIGGNMIPDPSLESHAIKSLLNVPYRMLVIKNVGSSHLEGSPNSFG